MGTIDLDESAILFIEDKISFRGKLEWYLSKSFDQAQSFCPISLYSPNIP